MQPGTSKNCLGWATSVVAAPDDPYYVSLAGVIAVHACFTHISYCSHDVKGQQPLSTPAVDLRKSCSMEKVILGA